MKVSIMKSGWVIGIAAALVALLVLGFVEQSSNCGRNSSALSHCREYSLLVAMAVKTNAVEFNVSKFDLEQRNEVLRLATNHWNRGAQLLIKTNFVLRKGTRQIIAAYDTAYSNVPEPAIWNGYRKNPAHAVGYDDGSSGLISPAQFQALDRSSFMDAAGLAGKPRAVERE